MGGIPPSARELEILLWGIFLMCDGNLRRSDFDHSQSAFTCSKLTIETLEQGVKYVQS